MAHRRTSHHRRSGSRSRRNRRRSRGGGYSFGSAYVSPGNLVVQPNTRPGGPDCLAASRPGELSGLPYGGLPGMRGGGYTMSMTPFDASRGFVPTPSQAVRIPCESNAMNPLNMRGGSSDSGFPVLNVGKSTDMMAYHAPTGGYSNTMSSSGGVPLMIQAPYAAKSCLSTGGSRRTRRHKRRHKRRHTRSHKRRH